MKMDGVFQALQDLPHQTREIFLEYHLRHPQVWTAFEKFALQVAARKPHFGAKAIMERVRYEAEIERGEEFKCNNNYTSYYARIFVAKYPQYKDLFEFREVNGLKDDHGKMAFILSEKHKSRIEQDKAWANNLVLKLRAEGDGNGTASVD